MYKSRNRYLRYFIFAAVAAILCFVGFPNTYSFSILNIKFDNTEPPIKTAQTEPKFNTLEEFYEHYANSDNGGLCETGSCCSCRYQNCDNTPGSPNFDFEHLCERWINEKNCSWYDIEAENRNAPNLCPAPLPVPPNPDICDGNYDCAFFGHGNGEVGRNYAQESIELCTKMCGRTGERTGGRGDWDFEFNGTYSCSLMDDWQLISQGFENIKLPEGCVLTFKGNQSEVVEISGGICQGDEMSLILDCCGMRDEFTDCNEILGKRCFNHPALISFCERHDASRKREVVAMKCCHNCANLPNFDSYWQEATKPCPASKICGTRCYNNACLADFFDSSPKCLHARDCSHYACEDGMCTIKEGPAPIGVTTCDSHKDCGRFACEGPSCIWKSGTSRPDGESSCLTDWECPYNPVNASCCQRNAVSPLKYRITVSGVRNYDPNCDCSEINGSYVVEEDEDGSCSGSLDLLDSGVKCTAGDHTSYGGLALGWRWQSEGTSFEATAYTVQGNDGSIRGTESFICKAECGTPQGNDLVLRKSPKPVGGASTEFCDWSEANLSVEFIGTP